MRRAALILLLLLAQSAHAQQQRVIKDPAEYKAYMAAYEQKDAGRRAAAMEAFAAQYPQSVVRLEALEQALASWQQAGNRDKIGQAADEILKVDADNLRALAIRVFLLRAQATTGDSAALGELGRNVWRGLTLLGNWRKPDGMTEAEFARLKSQVGTILNGAAGFVALQQKDLAKARPAYLQAVAADPNDLQNVYQLSLACLEASPVVPDGFWYVARAVALADPAVKESIKKYAAAKYRLYHGSDQGFAELLARAGTSSAKPAGFAVKPAP